MHSMLAVETLERRKFGIFTDNLNQISISSGDFIVNF